jgi:HEAT repeat protein
VIGLFAGCGRSAPPPITDPAKAPWLLDASVQIEGLNDRDYRIRGLSAFNLGNMGAKAEHAIPILEKLATDDPNTKVRENAREALEKIRGASEMQDK